VRFQNRSDAASEPQTVIMAAARAARSAQRFRWIVPVHAGIARICGITSFLGREQVTAFGLPAA
jgi:hypothetical protein